MKSALKIFALTIIVSAFYSYVGQMVPQKITYPPETLEIRLLGSPTTVARTAAWLRAQGLVVQSESSDRPSREAAGQVHVTQPALSAQIQQLEQLLGVVLFERDRRKTLLTAAGSDTVRRAGQILQIPAVDGRDQRIDPPAIAVDVERARERVGPRPGRYVPWPGRAREPGERRHGQCVDRGFRQRRQFVRLAHGLGRS